MKVCKFSQSVFSLKSLSETVHAYRKLANIAVTQEGGYFSVVFSECRFDEERTAREFENYLIGAENSRNGIAARDY